MATVTTSKPASAAPALEWDYFEYHIGGHYLPAMINADYNGMTDDECAELAEFERVARGVAHAAGFTVGHWADMAEEGEDFRRCDVSGLHAQCVAVRLMVYRNGAAS